MSSQPTPPPCANCLHMRHEHPTGWCFKCSCSRYEEQAISIHGCPYGLSPSECCNQHPCRNSFPPHPESYDFTEERNALLCDILPDSAYEGWQQERVDEFIDYVVNAAPHAVPPPSSIPLAQHEAALRDARRQERERVAAALEKLDKEQAAGFVRGLPE